jgi:hypothetical protein
MEKNAQKGKREKKRVPPCVDLDGGNAFLLTLSAFICVGLIGLGACGITGLSGYQDRIRAVALD